MATRRGGQSSATTTASNASFDPDAVGTWTALAGDLASLVKLLFRKRRGDDDPGNSQEDPSSDAAPPDPVQVLTTMLIGVIALELTALFVGGSPGPALLWLSLKASITGLGIMSIVATSALWRRVTPPGGEPRDHVSSAGIASLGYAWMAAAIAAMVMTPDLGEWERAVLVCGVAFVTMVCSAITVSIAVTKRLVLLRAVICVLGVGLARPTQSSVGYAAATVNRGVRWVCSTCRWFWLSRTRLQFTLGAVAAAVLVVGSVGELWRSEWSVLAAALASAIGGISQLAMLLTLARWTVTPSDGDILPKQLVGSGALFGATASFWLWHSGSTPMGTLTAAVSCAVLLAATIAGLVAEWRAFRRPPAAKIESPLFLAR